MSTLTRSDGHGEEIGGHTVGDPFLLAVDDVVLTVLGLLGFTSTTSQGR